MRKNFIILAVLILLLFGGCLDELSIKEGVSGGDKGAAGGALYVPGGEGRTTDDLDFDDDMKTFSMDTGIDPEIVTTQETLGRWKDDGKYHIAGLSYLGTSSLSATGFVDSLFVYYNKPLTGDYKISARVRITAVQGFSTSKGLQFGVFAPGNPPTATGSQVFSGGSRSMGILFRSSIGSSNPLGEIRYYYATNVSNVSFTAGTSSHPGNHIIHNISYKNEYIFEMSRNSAGYTMKVLNSKTGELIPKGSMQSYNNPHTVSETASGTSAIHTSLLYDAPVYAGFALMGSSAEISQIRIWDNAAGAGNPIFSTPDTQPGYVPVERITLDISPVLENPADVDPKFFKYNLSEFSGGGIPISPLFEPSWADNNRVQWLLESCEPEGAITITGTGDFSIPGKPELGTTYTGGLIAADGNKFSDKAAAVITAVARDLNLDNFDGFPAVDYPIKQTLAEYRFIVEVTK